MCTAEQLWPRNSLLEWKDWANTVIPFTHVVYSTGRSRNPPRDTFGGKHCFPGVAENEYSRTALASKFSFGMERLSKYCNSLYTCSIFNRMETATPRETLLVANIAFRWLLKMCTAEQLWPRNSLLEWKDWANTAIPFTHVVYSTGRSRNPPRDTFGGKHCFPGVAENEYSRTALASKFSFGMEKFSKYCNSFYTCSILNRTIPQPPERHFWGQTLLSGGCWKWVQPNSSGLEILFWNGKIEQIL